MCLMSYMNTAIVRILEKIDPSYNDTALYIVSQCPAEAIMIPQDFRVISHDVQLWGMLPGEPILQGFC